ncbi:metallophosphoesterase family protein [Armatimonas rosea]|uniref:Nuclease SbcCD subunit D n=1 Tax=Armatimonas rosea TaxID=685828 RepID=A0A7W9SPJ6_ARMRO|nr:metallophosphoesterase [Armatimonas rosea]MBB6050426.1 DNA repair exonuclease SbcCD nuclease subunit [Armatimonas rosea]
MIKAIVVSDCHLGTYYARFRPERLEQRRRQLQQGFAKTVQAALDHDVELFLIAGDLFDRPDPRNADRHFVALQLGRLAAAKIPAVAIAGNHDSPRSYGYDGGIVPLQEMHALGGVQLLRQDDVMQGVQITVRSGATVSVRGMSASFQHDDGSCPLSTLAADKRGGALDIVLLHYGVEGWSGENFQEPRLALENLEKLDTDVICVGHLHRRNERRLQSGALLLNPGSTEHIHFGEEKLDCGCYLLTLATGQPAKAEYLRHTVQPMRTLEVSGETLDETDPQADLERRIAEATSPETLFRLTLTGELRQEVYELVDLNRLQTFASERSFHSQIQTDDLAIRYPFGELVFSSGGFELNEVLSEVAQAMELSATDEEQRALCREAREAILASYQRLRGTGVAA